MSLLFEPQTPAFAPNHHGTHLAFGLPAEARDTLVEAFEAIEATAS
jgi:hypothetical protein